MTAPDPHGEIDVATGGVDLETADAAAIALHGRGATAGGMLDLLAQADQTGGRLAHLAPQAARRTWYPHSFLEPTSANEPHLSSALEAVEVVTDRVARRVGRDRTVLVGFSQGACLASEFVASHPARYGGLLAFSGGLIGDSIDRDRYRGSLEGTPAYLGCSDVDPHIPVERVHETSAVLEELNAEVTTAIFPGMGHTVNRDELEALTERLRAVVRD